MNEHSPKFELVKNYYNKGQWKLKAVRNAVIKYWITAEEFEEITGEVPESFCISLANASSLAGDFLLSTILATLQTFPI